MKGQFAEPQGARQARDGISNDFVEPIHGMERALAPTTYAQPT
jgi:hypothetical protein